MFEMLVLIAASVPVVLAALIMFGMFLEQEF
jgi:hypothetical protein